MCLIAFALDTHPRYSLVLAANRDEFHARPSAPATSWDDMPQIFGGRDLQQLGGWLALHRDGRWAAVTNVRRMEPPDPQAPSRGALVAGYLHSGESPSAWATRLGREAGRYAGFNLLLGQQAQAQYLSNSPAFVAQELASGVHAVSNASLDTPWPKLQRLKNRLQQWCTRAENEFEPLFATLADTRIAADAELPDTGIGRDRERFLSPPFIRSPLYGTRASTLLAIGRDGRALFHERRFGPDGAPAGETRQWLELG